MEKIIDISELIPDNENANKGSEFGNSLIEKSLRKFGAGRSILLDKNNKIVAGNKTIENAASIGLNNVIIVETDGTKLVAVKRNDIDLDSEVGREMAIADNASAKANIEWDEEVLEKVKEQWNVNLEGWGVALVDLNPKEVEEEEELVNTEEVKTSIKGGDLIEIGRHRLICGDSTKEDVFTKLFESKMADLVVTDPPYNVAYTGKNKIREKIQNDNMKNEDFLYFLETSFNNLSKYTKKGGSWYVWHSELEAINFRLAMTNAGILVKQCLVWVKNSIVFGRADYQWKHEPCLYSWKDGDAHNWYSDRKQTTVLEFDKPLRSDEHPTMKPVKLISYLINNSSKKGDMVADAFLGSGTTMVAAEEMDRICYGIEIEPKYCQVIINRMHKLYPELEVKINGELANMHNVVG